MCNTSTTNSLARTQFSIAWYLVAFLACALGMSMSTPSTLMCGRRQQLRRTEGSPEFVFYDGPPFATGLPHYGHLLAGSIKACSSWQPAAATAACIIDSIDSSACLLGSSADSFCSDRMISNYTHQQSVGISANYHDFF